MEDDEEDDAHEEQIIVIRKTRRGKILNTESHTIPSTKVSHDTGKSSGYSSNNRYPRRRNRASVSKSPKSGSNSPKREYSTPTRDSSVELMSVRRSSRRTVTKATES